MLDFRRLMFFKYLLKENVKVLSQILTNISIRALAFRVYIMLFGVVWDFAGLNERIDIAELNGIFNISG